MAVTHWWRRVRCSGIDIQVVAVLLRILTSPSGGCFVDNLGHNLRGELRYLGYYGCHLPDVGGHGIGKLFLRMPEEDMFALKAAVAVAWVLGALHLFVIVLDVSVRECVVGGWNRKLATVDG
ncbi:hypothetical protein B0T24DRAFT_596512 [Lasiosphaeria ovina]|uniref:Wax synthase domain-containing protein n=1 Tax=Lasiosphaeria ovina TaxID=92902 RepID=A0AAE0JZ05_9PEZI|nr:hypothetical protein B0T24DRAFT_596512 [Lasiosphaeria ovina]